MAKIPGRVIRGLAEVGIAERLVLLHSSVYHTHLLLSRCAADKGGKRRRLAGVASPTGLCEWEVALISTKRIWSHPLVGLLSTPAMRHAEITSGRVDNATRKKKAADI